MFLEFQNQVRDSSAPKLSIQISDPTTWMKVWKYFQTFNISQEKNTENQEETTICFNFQHTTFNPIINRTNKADIITFKRETTNNA